MKTASSTKRGFTLMELLVVIGIIGILASLLLRTLASAKANAHSATCNNQMDEMGIALQSYVNEHANHYPKYPEPYDTSLNNERGTANTRYWWAELIPYCPMKWTNTAFHCPGYNGATTAEVYPPLGSYAYNRTGVSFPHPGIPFKPDLGLSPPTFGIEPNLATDVRVKVPSEMLAISESRFMSLKENCIPGGYDFLVCGFLGANPISLFAFDPKRHGKNYNALFCDGHVNAMNPWILFDPAQSATLWNADHQPHPETWARK